MVKKKPKYLRAPRARDREGVIHNLEQREDASVSARTSCNRLFVADAGWLERAMKDDQIKRNRWSVAVPARARATCLLCLAKEVP